MSLNPNISLAARTREFLGLNRSIGVLALSTLGLALGEELWLAFFPTYLVALGASGLFVGAFSSLKDLLDGLYQYPGGWLSDRIGLKRSLMIFTAIALAGYGVAAVAPTWEVLFAALILIMAWKSGAFPATFAVIGEALPKGKRGIAFSIISVLQRVPRVLGAPLGGLLIATYGVIVGVRSALAVTMFLAVCVLLLQRFMYRPDDVQGRRGSSDGIVLVFKSMSSTLGGLKEFGEPARKSFIVDHADSGQRGRSVGVYYLIRNLIIVPAGVLGGLLWQVSPAYPLIAGSILGLAGLTAFLILSRNTPEEFA